jgi:hypothetical protein
MPESYGKRQRKQVRGRKASAREERRIARNQRKAAREAGLLPGGPGEGEPHRLGEQEDSAGDDSLPRDE